MLLYKWRKKITKMSKSLEIALNSKKSQDNFTLNPEDGTVWVFKNQDHRLAAFRRHSKNKHVVYFYATTDGKDMISYTLKIGYARLLEANKTAYIGRWNPINSDDATIDSVEAIDDGIDDTEIKAILKQYDQETAVKLEAKYDENDNIIDVTMSFVDG